MEILQQFMDAVGHRLNDAWEHQWPSYTNGQALGYHNEFASLTIVFDRVAQEVIEITATSEADAQKEHYYRWINSDYLEAIKAESESRGLQFDRFIDEKDYTNLDLVEDILEKGVAMLADEEFDERVMIPLDLEDSELLELFKSAHKRDMSLNQYLELILKKVISDAEPNTSKD